MDDRRFVRIVLADDHPIFRHGLKALLHTDATCQVVGEATDGRQAVRLVRELRPDVLLLDLAMPEGSGLDTLTELARTPDLVRTIVLTAGLDRSAVVTAVQLGASGVLTKDAAVTQLFDCIRCVMRGHYWLDRDTVGPVVEQMRRLTVQATSGRQRFGLTPRQLQIVAGVLAGDSNRTIARQLSVSEDTVKHHLSTIFDKVGVFSRVELAVFALRHNLVPDDPTEAAAQSAIA